MIPELLSQIRHRNASNVEDMADALQCDQDRGALLLYVDQLEAALVRIADGEYTDADSHNIARKALGVSPIGSDMETGEEHGT